jgi:hypothetical protein
MLIKKVLPILEGLVEHLEWREDFLIEDAEEGNENTYSKAKALIEELRKRQR